MARLSTIDAFWMNAEKEGPPFAIGALLVMEGPAPSLHELRTLIAGRTATAERMRQRLESDTLRLRQAEWVADDPDYGHHVREVAVESPGTSRPWNGRLRTSCGRAWPVTGRSGT